MAATSMPAAPPPAEQLPLARRLAAFAFLMVAEFFYAWAWNTVDVLRPQIRAELKLSLVQAGSAYSAQAIGALAGALILGQLADRFGKRRVLVVIMVGYALAGAAGSLVPDYRWLLVQRFVLGAFLGGLFPVLIALYMGLFPAHWRGKLASVGNATFNLAVIALGASLSLPAAQADWHVLQWGAAIPPLLAAPLALLLVPDDRRMRPWGAAAALPPAPLPASRLPVAELFTPALRRRTLLLALLIGVNFFAYQAFSGWVTTYLTTERGFDAAAAGRIIAWQFGGSLLGGFFWGWFSDRYGRRASGLGFVLAVGLVLAYVLLLDGEAALRLAGFVFGFVIACSVAWAPWMAELFPAHLRSTALSIFQWGRIISFLAPLITGAVADRLGVQASMLMAAAAFALAAALWFALPETLRKERD